MDGKRLGEITEERFKAWTVDLAANQATPTLVVATGHNENDGEVFVFAPASSSRNAVAHLLLDALFAVGNLTEHKDKADHGIHPHANGGGEPTNCPG